MSPMCCIRSAMHPFHRYETVELTCSEVSSVTPLTAIPCKAELATSSAAIRMALSAWDRAHRSSAARRSPSRVSRVTSKRDRHRWVNVAIWLIMVCGVSADHYAWTHCSLSLGASSQHYRARGQDRAWLKLGGRPIGNVSAQLGDEKLESCPDQSRSNDMGRVITFHSFRSHDGRQHVGSPLERDQDVIELLSASLQGVRTVMNQQMGILSSVYRMRTGR